MAIANDHGNPVNISAVGITVAVFAAIACHMMLNMLGVGVGVLAATMPDNVDPEAASWAAFGWWAGAGIVSSFVGGWIAGWIAAGRDASPGMHGIAMWAATTVIVVGAASMIAAVGGTTLGNLAGPGFADMPATSNTEITTVDTAVTAGTMALASFVALLIGLIAAYIGAQMGAQREASHHHHVGAERAHMP